MLQFTKLRLSGFKSFVEPAEVEIAPGLTGIVGPNGCGKSNLVEALRWVMGESSARQMRAGEMEDVIFGGSGGRPSRALAEVAVSMRGAAHTVPAVLVGRRDPSAEAGDVEVEIRRRIERGKGSSYRVNGREARARDVQLLFADAASGARSAAMVTQGQVGELILARPAERRLLLDEAAGISGLHPRRHEAELRLRAAEANLARLDDVLATLAAQLENLRKHARQAARYRTLCEQIRKVEAGILRARWQAAATEVEAGERRLASAETGVAEAVAAAAACSTTQAEAAAALPELRAAATEAIAALQALELDRERLEDEARRGEAERDACLKRLEQAGKDLARAKALGGDAEATVRRLEAERERLLAAADGEDVARGRLEAGAAAATAAVADLDRRLMDVGERLAAEEAQRAGLARSLADLDGALRRLDQRAAEAERQRLVLDAEARGLPDPDAAEAAATAAEALLAQARADGDAAAERARTLAAAAASARDELQRADAERRALSGEIATLEKVLRATTGSGAGSRLIDALEAEPGFEAALAAAFGDELLASVDPAQPAHWRELPALADGNPLPPGAEPLSARVRGPAAAERRLSQTGLIADPGQGQALQPMLRPGQCLVGRDGGLWRWDGFTLLPQAPSKAAVLLEQRNRLAALRADLAAGEAAYSALSDRAGEAAAAAATAGDAEKAARNALKTAEAGWHRARDALAEARQAAARIGARLAVAAEAAAAVAAERAEVSRRREDVAAALAEAPDPTARRQSRERLRQELGQAREREREARAALDAQAREVHGRRRRIEAIGRDLAGWSGRRDEALAQIEELDRRERAERSALAELEAQPARIAGRRAALLDALEAASAKRRQTGDAAATAEAASTEADRALRAAERRLAEAREERVRAEAARGEAERVRRETALLIAERLGVEPEALADLGPAEAMAPAGGEVEAGERRLERLKRERETMGPVNLRADEEAAEVGARIEDLNAQRHDLTLAIAKLRRGIADLDREGRERLSASFAEVDAHFRELFTRLFGGGRAHLALTDADDPLEAGLEIMACPPGKKLQALSLLSGGEQVLTALALRFAVFLTNPAPICVLDEVDAPLDDANVDRFCRLLAEMADGGTRFLVITHHRMTMARMDRLFGVTMAERGVSELVSVDLRRAEELRETA
ncbi:MAG: chromosome segregation protein SMC [Rhodospirillales bacterium]|nr:chromosome segregation protein SMC [Rhodospirillales bacterium]